MNEFQEYSKIFNSWEVTEEIGSGSYGKVFKMERNEGGVSYTSALKVITIPQNDSEIKAKKAEGETQESISTYYQGVTEGLLNEIKIMAELKGNSNIVSYEDHQIVRHEDGIGCDIFIRMELLTSFIDYMASNEITEKDIIRLGIDICKALEICEKKGIIHRDIKPGNIFVSNTGDFKLGDFGIARTIEKTVGGLSKKGTYRYMAPEVYKGDAYGKTVDICSLGLVMYYLANGKRTPFLPDAPIPVTHDDEENALIRRMRGERIMPPKFASNGLASIILKACSYDGRDRYSDAEQMRHDLEALAAGKFHGQQIKTENTGMRPQYAAANSKAPQRISERETYPERKSANPLTKRKKILILILILVIIASIIVIFVVKNLATSNLTEESNSFQNEEVSTEELTETTSTDSQSDGNYEIYANGYCHMFYFDTNGGSEDIQSMEVNEGQEITLPSKIPEKPGYDFIGWQVKRLVDDKYYYTSVYNWMDINQGNSEGYSPSLYQPNQVLLFDDSWKKVNIENSNYVFVAIWD